MIDLVPWIPTIVGAIAAVATIIAATINRGGAARSRREPTWSELLERVTDLEEKVQELERSERRKMGAVLRILRSIASQWPTSTGPDLDPRDIELIEETIPPQWIRRGTPNT